MKKPERRLFVSVACAAALMVCGAVMMHLDKKPDEATFFAMDAHAQPLFTAVRQSR